MAAESVLLLIVCVSLLIVARASAAPVMTRHAHPRWHDDLRLVLETVALVLVMALVVIGLPVLA